MNVQRQTCLSKVEAGAAWNVPWRIRLLSVLSTRPWRPGSEVDAEVASLAERMVGQGWMVRGAYPRNYLLWRSSHTLSATTYRLVVLPIVFGRLSDLEINIFLATDLFVAKQRAALGSADLSEEQSIALDSLCQRLTARSGMALLNRERVYRKAEKEVESAILRG